MASKKNTTKTVQPTFTKRLKLLAQALADRTHFSVFRFLTLQRRSVSIGHISGQLGEPNELVREAIQGLVTAGLVQANENMHEVALTSFATKCAGIVSIKDISPADFTVIKDGLGMSCFSLLRSGRIKTKTELHSTISRVKTVSEEDVSKALVKLSMRGFISLIAGGKCKMKKKGQEVTSYVSMVPDNFLT